MIDYFFDLRDVFPYLYCFPIGLLIVFLIFFFGKSKIQKHGIAFYGVFMGLTNRNILSLSLLFIYYYFIIVSIFINRFSFLTLILLVVPISLFHFINFYFIRFFIDAINTVLIYTMLYSKSIFYHYMIEVGRFWYVALLYVLLCFFIILYATYIFIRRFKVIIASNKYIENKK